MLGKTRLQQTTVFVTRGINRFVVSHLEAEFDLGVTRHVAIRYHSLQPQTILNH